MIDVSALRERLADVDEETAANIARAHEIVDEEVGKYVLRRRADALSPLIRAIRRRGDEIAGTELRRYASRLTELTPDERAAVEGLVRGIVAKLLHDPIVGLKERTDADTQKLHARVLAELLGLEPDTT